MNRTKKSAQPRQPEPLNVRVLPAMAPIMLAKLDKLLNTKDGAQRSVGEGETFATTVDGVTLNGDDHEVLSFIRGALVEAQVARLRGER